MDWLLQARDDRGLSYIAQGDWCDPMNMVGYKGRGVSGWLTVAAAYALNLWAGMCEQRGDDWPAPLPRRRGGHERGRQRHLWDGAWYARGITDDDVIFGVSNDKEGRIYLNPQAWAILGGAAGAEQRAIDAGRGRRPARSRRTACRCSPRRTAPCARTWAASRRSIRGRRKTAPCTTTPPCSTSTACTRSARTAYEPRQMGRAAQDDIPHGRPVTVVQHRVS
jgi:hypothetical protein